MIMFTVTGNLSLLFVSYFFFQYFSLHIAMRNRRLFPAATEANETIECSNFCDPACPYNCYPYQDYYYLPPLPPPPPPPPFLVQNHYISPYVIILVSVLASFILLIGYYVIIVKSCFGWCCWRNNNRLSQPQADGSNEEFVDENRVDHPIWFITTVGLQQSIINSITVCKYKKGEGLIEGTECSVCLNEFQEDETVRLLPKCNHAFHISCIDTWLRAHTNCPLCRAPIVFDAICSNTPTSADRNPDNIAVIDDNQIGNSENVGIISDENRSERELVETNDQRVSKEVIINSDENQRGVVAKEITQLKRCVSMDSSSSSSAASLFIGIQDDVENPDSSIIATKENWSGNSSFAQGLHLSPVQMKRSFSCGGRFFSSSKRYLSMNSNLPP